MDVALGQLRMVISSEEVADDKCRMLLEAYDYNVERAINAYFENGIPFLNEAATSTITRETKKARGSIMDFFTPAVTSSSSSSVVVVAAASSSNNNDKPTSTTSSTSSSTSSTSSSLPYAILAECFDKIESTTGRIKIVDFLTDAFLKILKEQPGDLLAAVYLCMNCIAPPYENVELSLGPSIISKAICDATGTSMEALKKSHDEHGDIGNIAELNKNRQTTLLKPAPITIRGFYETLRKISGDRGSGSANRKRGAVTRLIAATQGKETRFLVRTLVQNLRVGAVDRTILTALGRAVLLLSNPSANKEELTNAAVIMKRCYCEFPNLDRLVPALIEGGLARATLVGRFTAGVPMKAMLGSITHGIEEALERMNAPGAGQFRAEFKYDGQRCQAHIKEGKVTLFSRHLENMTEKYPDVCGLFLKSLAPNVTSAVFDSEIVAIDGNTLDLMPFQILATRAKKRVQSGDIVVKVCVFVFDMMELNGEPLLERSLRERRDIASKVLTVSPGELEWAKGVDMDPSDKNNNEALGEHILSMLHEAVRCKCEGLMIKALDVEAGYTPSKRSEGWLKVKKDYCFKEGLADSFDLVPIAAWYGMGRKAGWFSPFLMASVDDDGDTLQSFCKVMTGFTDQLYKDLTEYYTAHRIDAPKSYYQVHPDVTPDVWLEPCEVWEIRGADITVSPLHQTGCSQLDHGGRGLSLRFPRFIRKRTDKAIEDATNSSQIVDMFKKQFATSSKKIDREVKTNDNDNECVPESDEEMDDDE